MKEKKESNIQVQITLVLIFIILAVVLFFALNNRRNYNQQQHLQLITERYQLVYNTIYDQHKQLATALFSGILERFAVQELYQKLLTADEGQKNRLRTELLAKIRPRYEELKKETKVRQLHFHLQNNESFLRLHRPGKYGDNLTGIRETVSYVNTEHEPIDGFEEGRIYNGYRFVFPITAADQTHLGSMEISFGPDALTSAMMKQYFVISNFLIKQVTIKEKVFADEQENNYSPSFYKDMDFDNNVLAELKKVSRTEMEELRPQKNIIEALYANAYSGRPMSIYDPSINMTFTTIPVFNPLTREMVACFTVRSQSGFFMRERRYFWSFFSLVLLLLAMTLSTFSLQNSKSKILEKNTRQLEKQRQQLIDAQKIANLGHWELDLLTNHLSWSDQIYHIFELQPGEFAATIDAFLARVHPDDRDLVSTSYIDHVENHAPYDLQHRIVTKDGTEKWVREICNTEYDKAGKPLRSLGIIYDITEQHNILNLLQRERDMFMQGPVMTFTRQNSENWPIEQVSTNVSEILGYSEQQFFDGSVYYASLIHPDDREKVLDEVATASQREEKSFIHEPYRLLARDGKTVWVQDHTTIIRNSEGEITHYQGYLVDITNTMSISKELRDSKERLELVINGANLGTWDWDVVTGAVVFNERWAEILGYRLDEIKHHVSTWEKIIHPDEREEITRILTDHLEGRTPVYMTEYRLKHKSGKWIWVLDVGKVFERDDEGNPIRAVGIHLDITEQKEAEQQVTANALYLDSILQSSTKTAIIAADTDFRIKYFNPAAERVFAADKATVLGKTIREIHQSKGQDAPDPGRFNRTVEQVRQTGSAHFSLQRGPVTFDVRISNINDRDGRFAGFLLMAHDVTEQKEVEQQLVAAKEAAEAANRAKSAFLSNMSHELRTPLNAILGYTQLFRGDTSLTAKQQSGIQTMHQSGEHLLLLINDILDLSKIEANKMELVKTEFQLHGFFQGISDIIRVRSNKKGLDFRYQPAATLPLIVEGDELRLRQVLLNLLSNAVKFTRKGHCTLRVSSQAITEDRIQLTITVEDSGAGIAPEMVEKVFEPFQQTGERLKYAEGSGLGLSISRKLVHLMGGELQLVSPINESPAAGEGKGSRFSFTLEMSVAGTAAAADLEARTVTGYTVPGEEVIDEEKMLVPSQELLDNLVNLVESGDISGVTEKAAEITEMESGKYQSFAQRIKYLADELQLNELEKFIALTRKD